MKSMKEDLIGGLKSVLAEWKKAKLKSERVPKHKLDRMRYYVREETMKDLVWEVMKEAYNKASSNGRYYANARQIMYQARALVKNKNPDAWKQDSTFQVYLKDYILEERPDWASNVVWSAKGNFIEPHTRKTIALGGVEIREYEKKWKSGFEVLPKLKSEEKIKTKGPTNRFNAVLFMEKEGFTQILMEAGIFEKYDMAFMSTKGLPTDASCDLNKAFGNNVKIFALCDFDLAGFKIVRTLRKGTQLTTGSDIIDMGLRLKDVQYMGLESEPVTYNQRKDPKEYLRECGATEKECKFLVESGDSYFKRSWNGQRVELNMMTSEQLIEFIEKKLEEHGVEKVIPEEPVLKDAYKRAIYFQQMDNKCDAIRRKMMKENIKIPDDLEKEVKEYLGENETESWDNAIWKIVKKNKGLGCLG